MNNSLTAIAIILGIASIAFTVFSQMENNPLNDVFAQTETKNIEESIHDDKSSEWVNVHSNVKTDFNPKVKEPKIKETAFIHPFAIVIGDCSIGKMVLVAPTAVCRGDE